MLDTRSLALMMFMSAAIFSLATLTIWRLLPQQRGLSEWVKASLLLISSTLLLSLRDIIPDLLSIVVGNALLVLSLGFMYVGTRSLFGLQRGRPWHWVASAMMAVACMTYIYGTFSIPERIVALSLFLIPFFAGCGYLFWRHSEAQFKTINRITSLIFLTGAILFLARMIETPGTSMAPDFFIKPVWFIVVPYCYAILFNIWMSIMLPLKVSKQLQQQYLTALDHANGMNRELTDALDFNSAIILNSPIPMGVYAANGQCVLANDAYGQLIGYTRATLITQNFNNIVAWQSSGFLSDSMEALEKNIPKQRELYINTAFGKKLWIECRILPTQLKGEKHLLIQFFDMTEYKHAEEIMNAAYDRLAENERFIRAVTDNVPGLISYWDRELRCRFANKHYLEWFNKTQEEMIGIHLQELMDDSMFARSNRHIRKVLHGQQQEFEKKLNKASGESRDTLVTYIPDIDASGHANGFFALIYDVTALRQAEEAQRIAATAFDSNEAMMITDANVLILRVNRAFTEITGYEPAEIIGQTPTKLKSGRHNESFYEAMWSTINRTGSWQGEIWDRRKNGEIYPTWTTITAVKNSDNIITHYVCAQSDITLRKAAEAEISHLAFFDALTGLPNRRLLMDRLQQVLATSARAGCEGALMFIDLDNFKLLNDTYGHDKGDLLLKQVAERLTLCVREGDTVGRLGGDEFVIILEDLNENPEKAAQQAESICTSILVALNVPYNLAGHQHYSTPSIGVTLFTDHKHSAAELLKRADLAMYQAKADGRNAVRFFDSKLQDAVNAHVAMDEAFRLALAQREFVLHYQAQVGGMGNITGVEALVRWRHPQRGLLYPHDFIPLSEEGGLIIPLGQWVLETACRQLAAWAVIPELAHLTMAVNISPCQFRQSDFVEQVFAMLNETGANPRKLKLEVTESLLTDGLEDIIHKMKALQAYGIRFSLDNFGTGLSSLPYLKRLPLDQLKIDKSFIQDVLEDQNEATIVRTIVALAHSMGLDVIAGGVENDAQRQFLANHNCHAYQGFLYGHPLAAAEWEQHMQNRLVC